MKTICINCPMGCPLEITEEDGKITVRGYTCKRGLDYGVSEYTAPVRTVTTLMRTSDGGVVPVKTSRPVPNDIGCVVEHDILALGADIVVTGRPAPHPNK